MAEEIFDSPVDWVAKHVRTYVESGGRKGHRKWGVHTLLLTTRGRKSGKLRRTALIYGEDGDRYLVVASNGGAKRNPDWYFNLLANPAVEVQLGEETFRGRARPAAAEEKPPLWQRMVEIWPEYGRYQARVRRDIPAGDPGACNPGCPSRVIGATGSGWRGLVRRDKEFAEFFSARFDVARRVVYAMCGDWGEAEEIAQAAFVRVYARWNKIELDTVDAYLRTALTRGFLDTRRRGRAREQAVAEPPDRVAPAEQGTEDRVALRAALLAVPPGQRTVLVLRFLADLSVEQVADTLGCTTGTVKSQTARGLVALRAAYERTEEVHVVGR